MPVFFIGYPGDIGGACTEAWHTVQLWRRFGVDVHLVPTWGQPGPARAELDALGCATHAVKPEELDRVEGLAGSVVVSMCNGEFLCHAHRFRALGCPIVWVNCMTFLFDQEKRFLAESWSVRGDGLPVRISARPARTAPGVIWLRSRNRPPGPGRVRYQRLDLRATTARQRATCSSSVAWPGRMPTSGRATPGPSTNASSIAASGP